MRVYLISLICVLSLALSGCGISRTPVVESPDLPPLNPQEIPTQLPTNFPSQGDETPMNPPLPTPSDPALQGLLQKTRDDLAQRLSISITHISIVEATEVEWSDSSLGCPQPDMVYLEVITPGYRILLQADSTLYEYHSNRDAYFVYCENLLPPMLPKP